MRFALPLTLLCLITAGAAFGDDSRPPIPVSGHSEDFPAFGVTLTPPAGWVRDASAGGNLVVRWLKPDGKGKAEAFLEVDFSRSSLTNAQEWQHLTADLHAASLRTVETGNKIEGAWVKGDFQSAGLSATQMFVVTRDTTRYSAALVHKSAPTPAEAQADDALMEDFIVHWKWRDLEEPSSHLALLPKPFPAMGGLVKLSVPAVAQMVELDDAATHVQFQVSNLKTHAVEMTVDLNLKATPMPDMQQVGKFVKEKLKLDDDLVWTDVADKGSISQWVKASRDGTAYWVMFGGIKIDESHSILVSCTAYRPEATVQKAYWESVKEVVKSVAIPGKTAP